MRNNIDVRNNKLIHPFLFIYYYILIPTLHKKIIFKLPTIFATRFFHDSSFLKKAALSKQEGSFF